MAAEHESEVSHLDLGLGEPVVLSDVPDPADWEDGVKPDAGSQNESAGGAAAGATEEEPPFAGGAGEGDDLPESGLRE